MTLILCGFPSSGKTMFGKLASKMLLKPFCDVDELIEKTFGMGLNCREITLQYGDPYFRKLEAEAILSLKEGFKAVLATGGGTLLAEENVSHLKKLGPFIYLKTDPKTLWERICQKKELPSYLERQHPKKSFDHMLAVRIPIYERLADITIDTASLSSDAVVEAICKAYG